MKTLPKLILIILIISPITVNSISKINNNQTTNLKENVSVKRNKEGNIKKIKITITIPKTTNQSIIVISPKLFESITEYKPLKEGDSTNIELVIKNNSKYTYKYLENSLKISTNDLSLTTDSKNYVDTKAIGFDQNKIYDIFSPKRTFNSAIKALYNYPDIKKQNKIKLTNKSLNKKLKNKGYSGITELDKYYIDFYNKKYNLNKTNLNNYSYQIIKELFSGIKTNIKETNKQIIKLSYDYFYNKLLYITFNNEVVTDSTSHKYSIGTYMKNNINDITFKESFNLISPKSKKKNYITVNINDVYTTEVFYDYTYNAHIEFKLYR